MEVIFFISYLTILGDFAVVSDCRARQAGRPPPRQAIASTLVGGSL